MFLITKQIFHILPDQGLLVPEDAPLTKSITCRIKLSAIGYYPFPVSHAVICSGSGIFPLGTTLPSIATAGVLITPIRRNLAHILHFLKFDLHTQLSGCLLNELLGKLVGCAVRTVDIVRYAQRALLGFTG